MPPRVKLDEDWHARCIEALEVRYQVAVAQRRRMQEPLRQAIEILRRSKKPIRIQKGGQQKGQVVGIPDKICASITQIITRVVKEEIPIIPPEYDKLDLQEGPKGNGGSSDVTKDRIVTGRKYRDSSYAILAALWVGYDGAMGNEMHTVEVKRRAARFCDHEMEFDYRTRRQGAWKAKDQLVAGGYVNERFNEGSKYYYLTPRGAKACFILFNEKFHPSKIPQYELIKPKRREFTREEIFSVGAESSGGDNMFREADLLFADGSSNTRRTIPSGRTGSLSNNRNIPQLPVLANDHDFDDDLYETIPISDQIPVGAAPVSTLVGGIAIDAKEVRRSRLLKLDQSCAEKINCFIDMGMSEDEAWALYENGGADEEHAKLKVEDEDEFLTAVELSKFSSISNALESESQDPAYLLALEESMLDAEQSLVNNNEQNDDEKNFSDYVHCDFNDQEDFEDDVISISSEDTCDSKNLIPKRVNWNDIATPLATQRSSTSAPSTTSKSSIPISIDLTRDDKVFAPSINLRSPTKSMTSLLRKGPESIINLIDEPSRSSRDYLNSDDDDILSVSEVRSTPVKRKHDDRRSSGLRFIEDFPVSQTSISSNTSRYVDVAQKQEWRVSKTSKRIYRCEQVPAGSELVLLVDNRERKQNNYYREMLTCITKQSLRNSNLATSESNLILGDFTFVFENDPQGNNEEETPIKRKRNIDNANPLSYWNAGVVIERKCVRDIIGRSAEKDEGPHFKQERNLRNSGLNHPFMLIEGDCFRIANCIKPRVSRDEDMDKLDIISDSEELLCYICGVISRNFGTSHQVQVLNTFDVKETAVMLSAIGYLLNHQFTICKKSILAPNQTLLSKYWHWRPTKARRETLSELLSSAGVSADMRYRIQRRFDDKVSLNAAYELCDNSLISATLLKDLSVSASNLSRDYDDIEHSLSSTEFVEETQPDLDSQDQLMLGVQFSSSKNSSSSSSSSKFTFDGFGMKKMFDDSLRSSTISNGPVVELSTLQSKLLLNDINLLTILKSRRTVVKMNEEMNKLMDSFNGYPSHIIPSLFDASNGKETTLNGAELFSSSAWPLCKICVQDTLPDSSQNFSDSLCLLVLSGRVIVSALGLSIDKKFNKTGDSHIHNQNILSVIAQAVGLIERHYPVELGSIIQSSLQNPDRSLQIVWLVENLGRGIGRNGAFGRLHHVLTGEHEKDAIQIDSSESNGSRLCLDAKFSKTLENPSKHGFSHDLTKTEDKVVQRIILEKGIMSRPAAQYISDNAQWLYNLFVAFLMLRTSFSDNQIRYQILQIPESDNSEKSVESQPSNQMVSRFVHAMHSLALPLFNKEI